MKADGMISLLLLFIIIKNLISNKSNPSKFQLSLDRVCHIDCSTTNNTRTETNPASHRVILCYKYM